MQNLCISGFYLSQLANKLLQVTATITENSVVIFKYLGLMTMKKRRIEKILIRLSFIALIFCFLVVAYAQNSKPAIDDRQDSQLAAVLDLDAQLIAKRDELAEALRSYYIGQGSYEKCEKLIAETEALMAEQSKYLTE